MPEPRTRVRTKNTIPSLGPLDCTKCGACCISYSAVEVSATEDPQTPQELTVSLDGHLEYAAREIAERQLRRMATPCNNRCIALRGTIGQDIKCSIYAERPTVCRGYEKGSDACHQARGIVAFWSHIADARARHPELEDPLL